MNPGIALLDGVSEGARAIVQTGRHTDGDGPAFDTPLAVRLCIHRDAGGVPVGLVLGGIDFAEFDPRAQAEGGVGDVEYHAEEFILRILRIEGRDVAAPIGLSGDQQLAYEALKQGTAQEARRPPRPAL